MADEDEGLDETEEGEEGQEGDEFGDLEQKRFSGKKIVIAAVVAILVIGGGLTAFLLSGGEEDKNIEGEGEGEHVAASVVFYDLPEMLVNMNTGTRQASYLKIQVSLELSGDPLVLEELDQLSPRIIDIFQVYLRELRLEDLDGSAGMFRLKEELLKRANASVAPIQINDILFREMIVQ